jgi:hypothetical protein
MFDPESHYVEGHLDDLLRLSKQSYLLRQVLRTKSGTWDRLMVRLGSLLISLGNRLQEGRLYTGLSNHRA